MELVNIYESSHEEEILIFITNKDLNKTENSAVTEDVYGNCSELFYS